MKREVRDSARALCHSFKHGARYSLGRQHKERRWGARKKATQVETKKEQGTKLHSTTAESHRQTGGRGCHWAVPTLDEVAGWATTLGRLTTTRGLTTAVAPA